MSAPQRATLESLLEAADGKKVLRIVLKCDAQGSLEALTGALNQIESKKIDLEIIHAGVGPISESDILLASASNAVVVGFNVKVESMAVTAAKREGVQVKLYSIIYELIDQMKEAMAGLARSGASRNGHRPRRSETGFPIEQRHRGRLSGHRWPHRSHRAGAGPAAAPAGLRWRAFDSAPFPGRRERSPLGLECGIKLGDFSEYQVGDIIECYQLEQVAQKLVIGEVEASWRVAKRYRQRFLHYQSSCQLST